MKILVLNCGSSSFKYQLIDMDGEAVLAKGLVERIGIAGSKIKHTKTGKDPVTREVDFPNHTVAIKYVLEMLTDPEHGVLKDRAKLLRQDTGWSTAERSSRRQCLSPRSHPGYRRSRPSGPPPQPCEPPGRPCTYGSPPRDPERGRIRHGIPSDDASEPLHTASPSAITKRTGSAATVSTDQPLLRKQGGRDTRQTDRELKTVTCHLGNGSSITAVDGGKSVDTSLGYGTAEGVLWEHAAGAWTRR